MPYPILLLLLSRFAPVLRPVVVGSTQRQPVTRIIASAPFWFHILFSPKKKFPGGAYRLR